METPKNPAKLLLIVYEENKAERLMNALQPDDYCFQKILIPEWETQLAQASSPDLAILWFPYSSPDALPELESLVKSITKLNHPELLPVLLIIDKYGTHWVEPGYQLGVTDILTRPIHPLVLRQRVHQMLQARQTEQALICLKKSELSLIEERQRLFKVLDLLPVYVYLLKQDYSIYFANRTFIDLFGNPGQRKCYQLLRGRESPCDDCATIGALSMKNTIERVWNANNGCTYMVYDNLFEDTTGLPLVLEIGVDITEMMRSEAALVQEKERFRTVADYTYDWEYWVDEQGDLIYNSPACERITGRSAQAFVDNPDLLLKIIHPDYRSMVADHFHLERCTDDLMSIDYRILTDEGEERWIAHACQPVYDRLGKPVGRRVSNRDITDRKNVEQTALRSERLAAMGRLLASLAHEINNPLQAMYSNVELVMDFPIESDERQRYMQIIRSETERLMKIVDSILDFSRPRQAESRPVAVKPVIEQALFLARKQLEISNIQVVIDICSDLPDVLISEDQFKQVCLNLIINATQFISGGGKLVISTRSKTNMVEIDFADDGVGIPAEMMTMVFEPFFTTKVDGTGLGLAVSQNIIQRHGGIITLHSEQGIGSTFTVTLPSRNEAVPDQRYGS